ncbi:MAG: hypothetical protein ACJA1A_003591 [Saprospiraceae bacterium]|jgi:hypothetical protein
MALTREEMKEMRGNLAFECLADIANSTPEIDDIRLGYVSIQIDRQLWLSARHCPKPPYLDASDILPKEEL